MHLSSIEDRGASPYIVLLQTSSTMLYFFLKDKIKSMFNCKGESIIYFEKKSDIKGVRAVIGLNPVFSEKWFVEIDMNKFDSKDVRKIIKNSNTCVFFLTCSKYSIYKSLKEEFKDSSDVYDFYVNYLSRTDMTYLYDSIVPSDKRLSKQLFDYVVQSYGNDIDAVFELFTRLANGDEFNSRKDISDVCGIGGNSVESFIFSLLKELSGSDKGLKKVISNRVKAGKDLSTALGVSSMYNFMSRSIRLLSELKMLMISGVVYKTIRNLPDTYDEKALCRYQKYIWRLKQIPLSDLLRLRQAMGSKIWQSDMDFIRFIYNYYLDRAKCLLAERKVVVNGNVS